MIDIDELAYSIISKSIYKQPFCYFGLRCMPEAFINTRSDYLSEILRQTRQIIEDDSKFGKIIYTYLCYPSYFSIDDYDMLLDAFTSISHDTQVIISTKTFDTLITNAVKNVIRYEHGVYNLCNFMGRLPFLCIRDSPWLNKLLLNIIFKHKDLIRSPANINDYVLEMIESIYGSVDNYIDIHIDEFTIEI
jgi:hypothetical protein